MPATSAAGSPRWATNAAVSALFRAAVATRFCGAPEVVEVVDEPALPTPVVVEPPPAAAEVDVDVVVDAVVGDPLLHPDKKSAPTATATTPPSTTRLPRRIRPRNRH